MSTSAQYAAVPNVGVGQLSTANTGLDGTGTIVTVLTAGSSGSRIDNVQVKGTGPTIAGEVRLFLNNGTTSYLLCEIDILGVTPGISTKAFETGLQLNIVIPTGWTLRAATSVSQNLNVIAIGGNF